MEKKAKILRSEAVVRFQDCDPYGHLYNSKYLDYFMNAREDQLLENYGLDIYGLAQTDGLGWVVSQNQIVYFDAGLLMEKVAITSRIIEFTPRRIRVEFVMERKDGNRVKALMWSDFTHFDLKKRSSAEHDARFMEMFAEVHAPVEETTFPERVLAMRKRNNS